MEPDTAHHPLSLPCLVQQLRSTQTMTAEAERDRRTRVRLVWVFAAIAGLLVLLLVPPYVSISRYKNRIAELLSRSLGRPVRLSSVELRVLPRPGFLISDLTVQEDPAYGAEPILHASSVVASIRLFSLWRGRLEVSRISVDDASLNLVRNDEGRWNLDSVFHAASTQGSRAGGTAFEGPYLEATNSRINLKKGIEKLPYSLVNADLSFWEESPGDWRLRLRGQPARTDVSLDLADTGLVRLEGRVRSAAALEQMPLHLELDWRSAQLGQLSRLVLGSDPGWRGDLTGQMQVDGTAAKALVKARLSAVGVHRAEFAPTEPLDFDANCSFTYHHFDRSVEKLSCDSPLGDGHITLSGELPGDEPAQFTVEAARVPASAGLDVLRTLRSGFNSDLEASGTVSGRITYDPRPKRDGPEGDQSGIRGSRSNNSAAKSSGAAPRRAIQQSGADRAQTNDAEGPLAGMLTIEGLRLSGGGLKQPLQVSKPVTLEAVRAGGGEPAALTATVAIPAGGPGPLSLAVRMAVAGYQVSIRGAASLPRIREFAHVAGVAEFSAFDGLAGEPATLDLSAAGPWLPVPQPPRDEPSISEESLDAALAVRSADADRLSGTVTLHNANWRSDALANHVLITQAVLHLGNAIVWDPITFSYGQVKGSASFQPAPSECPEKTECVPQLDLRFGELDAAEVQASVLGARQPATGIAALIDRFRASSTPAWPQADLTVHSDLLHVGPVSIENAELAMKVQASEVEITQLSGKLLGGNLDGTGKLTKGDKPAYAFDGQLEKATPAMVCKLFSVHCGGGPIDARGHVELSGFTDQDLASSATGDVHFEWRRGTLQAADDQNAETPKSLKRFDHWIGDAKIGDNQAAISASEVAQGARKSTVDASITFTDPPAIEFGETAAPAKQAAKQ